MSESYNKDYRRHSSREDPRLARRESKSVEAPKQLYDKLGVPISPKHKLGNDSPRKDPRTRESSAPSWQNSGYNQSMQTAYQHLPPSVYNDPSQYATQGYNTYPAYQQNYGTSYNHYQGYGQQTAYMSGSVQPGPPGEEYPQSGWAPVGGYVAAQPQSQVVNQVQAPAENKNDENKKEAVVQEMKQQKAQLIKQREEYVRKSSVLRRELELLRKQKQELLSDHSLERDNEHILRENNKLQDEIQTKMKAIYNVIEMLSSIIRDNRKVSELEEQLKDESPKHHRKEKDQSRSSHKSPPAESFVSGGKYNYVHYDPELHWCRICDVFPKTAKDLLLHLQTKEHRETAQERDVGDSSPWHNLPPEPELPHYEGAPKKRLPIKGLQFFISAPAWYCKLCDTWIGDLHCASQHLKSQVHSQNYANFVEQNPHWEIEWLKDREKAHARVAKCETSDSEENEKKKKKHSKRSPSGNKEKKRKKKSKKRKKQSSDSSSTSSSSDSSSEEDKSDKSKSIRVAMRNMKVQAIMNEDLGGKWEMLGRLVEEHKRKEGNEMRKENDEGPKDAPPEDNLINQWMTVVEPPEKDKQLLDSLKDRMKQKQEAEKAKLAELERKKKEKEKQEQEMKEKKAREEREALEREEQKRREREREEFERIRDRDREHVKFKTREKQSNTKKDSPEHKRKPSRSPSVEHKKSRQQTPEKHKSNRYSENGRHSSKDRSHSRDRSPDSRHRRDDKDSTDDEKKRKSSNNKRLPFIGRMPLFKNKKPEEKVEKEIKKEDYDIPRQTRFQPGNLARAFIPEPDVVCFPKLSSIPPLTMPPPPPVQQVVAPEPPKISEPKAKTPPPPKISHDPNKKAETKKTPPEKEEKKETVQNQNNMMQEYQMMYDPAMMAQYQYDYSNMMYSMYDYTQEMMPPPESITQQQDDQVPLEHTMPLQPPPLPPDDPNDDLALLGISADDMAVQMF